MKTIFQSVSAFFEAEKWPVSKVKDQASLSMLFKGSHLEWTCLANAYEDERTFVFYSFCPFKASKESYPRVAELISRLNYAQLCGNYEMGYLDGEIRFRTSIEVPDSELSHLLIDRVVYNNVATVDMFLGAFISVVQESAMPLEAIAKC